jgi:hypothetical protein
MKRMSQALLPVGTSASLEGSAEDAVAELKLRFANPQRFAASCQGVKQHRKGSKQSPSKESVADDIRVDSADVIAKLEQQHARQKRNSLHMNAFEPSTNTSAAESSLPAGAARAAVSCLKRELAASTANDSTTRTCTAMAPASSVPVEPLVEATSGEDSEGSASTSLKSQHARQERNADIMRQMTQELLNRSCNSNVDASSDVDFVKELKSRFGNPQPPAVPPQAKLQNPRRSLFHQHVLCSEPSKGICANTTGTGPSKGICIDTTEMVEKLEQQLERQKRSSIIMQQISVGA